MLGAIALILVGAEAWYASRPRATIVATTPVVTVYPSREFALLDATGYVVTPRKAAISSKVAGRLEWLGVAEGSRVKAGEVIARLDGRDVKAKQDMLIRAPFDGVVLSKSAEVGDLVTPFSSTADSKRTVISIADTSTLEVEADVSAPGLAKVRVGQPCEIVLRALPDARFVGTVARIVPTVDRAKATVKVRFDAIDPRVLPEMSARVSFLSQPVTAEQQRPLTAVRSGALTKRDGRTVLYVFRDDTVTEVAVTPGSTFGDLTAFAGDARSGDRAVLEPSPRLEAGALIKPATR
ncbi:MAG TPA: efflux RND transporter periplasmic adaptor subunit [Casimicrobiaceae bacterium]|nr:efflux RND transporter periplasmic adaptor subunit [Casimicrobiaceae bacterium]